MLKFLLDVLMFRAQYMPLDIFNEMKREHPELKTRDDFADYMVDNLGSTYGEAYFALPAKYFV